MFSGPVWQGQDFEGISPLLNKISITTQVPHPSQNFNPISTRSTGPVVAHLSRSLYHEASNWPRHLGSMPQGPRLTETTEKLQCLMFTLNVFKCPLPKTLVYFRCTSMTQELINVTFYFCFDRLFNYETPQRWNHGRKKYGLWGMVSNDNSQLCCWPSNNTSSWGQYLFDAKLNLQLSMGLKWNWTNNEKNNEKKWMIP